MRNEGRRLDQRLDTVKKHPVYFLRHNGLSLPSFEPDSELSNATNEGNSDNELLMEATASLENSKNETSELIYSRLQFIIAPYLLEAE